MTEFVGLIAMIVLIFITGFITGVWWVAGQFGKQLKAEVAAGRISRDEALRIGELKETRR